MADMIYIYVSSKRYQQQIDTIKSYICRYFPVGTRVSRPQAGFILWLELPESIDTLELFHQAMDEKNLMYAGNFVLG